MFEHAYSARRLRARAGRSPGRTGLGPPQEPPPAGPAAPLAVVLGCVIVGAALWLVAELIPAVQARDASILERFTRLDTPHVDSAGSFLVHLLNPGLFVLWGIALVAFAMARERPRVAIAVIAVLAIAPFSAELLKPLLAHPHLRAGHVQIGAASWPSGHATAGLALVLCAVLVAPARLRPLVGLLGAAYAVAVGIALLILAWHMPSDVIGGFLLATLWIALAVAALRWAERRWPTALPL